MTRPLKVGRPAEQQIGQLGITVLFTNVARTRDALISALKLAQNLNAGLHVVVMRVVPYPLPLESPPVPLSFTERQVLELTETLEGEIAVHIHDCRDPEAALLELLQPNSVVIVGSRKTWLLPRREKRLVKKLRQAGHEVILAGRE